MPGTREQQLLRAFAALADTLVAGYDVVDLLQTLVDTCTGLLGASESGVLLADGNGELDLIVSTSEASRLVELMQLAADAGPCIDSFNTGEVISVPDIGRAPEKWSLFREKALEEGFRAVDAIPLRLREDTIGTLNLLRTQTGQLDEDDMVAAQAFADVATIGILHERTIAHSNEVREQLQRALNSRIVIEQAKGVIAYMRGVPIDAAFTLIRDYARSHQLGISHVAAAIVGRELEL
ncbi:MULTISPECIES: GAF and ANTAR domain-containing protein [unclassified Leifsonia]|uniref:GAF and ANTAR domain-containing protein n=1 Tax=unclassified Leifsonia TaxID=2663824 RepID=UPI0008A74344|nr:MULTISPECIES: GAF and ANTAR domain-containing protein [unclassified Leifsonia]SEI14053.1 GAF domain-containing protein [Leifsonia sp. CL154]SFM01447.1 GAF domain-containing protein [Leifsonia sp. CL147]